MGGREEGREGERERGRGEGGREGEMDEKDIINILPQVHVVYICTHKHF